MFNFLKGIFKRNTNEDFINEVQFTDAEREQGIAAFKAFVEGLELQSANNLRDAIERYDFAVENGLIYNSKLYKYRGLCYQYFAQHILAIEDFDFSISLEGNDQTVYYSRSKSKWYTHDFDGYKADLNTAIQLSKLNQDDKDENVRMEQNEWQVELKYADETISLEKQRLQLENKWDEYIKQAKEKSKEKDI